MIPFTQRAPGTPPELYTLTGKASAASAALRDGTPFKSGRLVCDGSEVWIILNHVSYTLPKDIRHHLIARRDAGGMIWLRHPVGVSRHGTTVRMTLNGIIQGLGLSDHYGFAYSYKTGLITFEQRLGHYVSWSNKAKQVRTTVQPGQWIPLGEGTLGRQLARAMLVNPQSFTVEEHLRCPTSASP